MSLHTTEAYVLRTYSLAEADKICVFLTRELGKVRGVAHGARKMKSRFGSSLEPLTEVSLTYYQKEGRELVSVSTCEIVRSHFHSAARDVATASAFSYLAELLSEFMPEHESNERIYRLVGAVLAAIEEKRDLANLLRYVEAWMLKLSGYFPDLSRCGVCDEPISPSDTAFLISEGAPRCASCSGGRGMPVGSELRGIIKELFRLNPSAFAGSRMRPEHIEQLGEINYHMIRHALERDLKSREFVKQFIGVPARR